MVTNHESDNVDGNTNKKKATITTSTSKATIIEMPALKKKYYHIVWKSEATATNDVCRDTKRENKKMVHASCTGARLFDNKNGMNVVWLCTRYFSVSVALFWSLSEKTTDQMKLVFSSLLFQRCLWVRRYSFIFGKIFWFFIHVLQVPCFDSKTFKREAERHKLHCIIIFLTGRFMFFTTYFASRREKKKRKIMNQVDKNSIKWRETKTKLCSK